MDEVWRPVTVYDIRNPDGSYKYEVSNLGRVRSTWHVEVSGSYRTPAILRQRRNQGYLCVRLYISSSESHMAYVHRLVAEAFVPNPHLFGTVSHKDRDKTNNCADNIQWGTEYQIANPVAKEVPRYNRRRVRQYTKDGVFVAEYKSALQAAKEVFVSNSGHIHRCCQRQPTFKSCGGFLWRYPEDDEFAKQG